MLYIVVYRGLAQLVARGVRDAEVARSSRVSPTSFLGANSSIGRALHSHCRGSGFESHLVHQLYFMQIEIEAKFLDIDKEQLRNILKKVGATFIHEERLMRRKNFDYPDNRLQKIGGWIRVRDEGDKVTLAYKQLVNRNIDGTKELSLTVEDFDKTCDLLLAMGLDNKSYQETKRERWDLGGVEVTIDTWPWLPTFVELEGQSEQALKNVALQIGLDWNLALHGSVENAYQTYYNVTEEEVDFWANITFVSVPEWLEIKRK